MDTTLVRELISVRQQVSSLKKRELELLERIRAEMPDPGTYTTDGYVVQVVPSRSLHISPARLRERGVDIAIIDYATVITEYVQYRCREVEER